MDLLKKFEDVDEESFERKLSSPYLEEEIFYFGSSYFKQRKEIEANLIRDELKQYFLRFGKDRKFELNIMVDTIYLENSQIIKGIKEFLIEIDFFLKLSGADVKFYITLHDNYFLFHIEKFLLGAQKKNDVQKLHDITIQELRDRNESDLEVFKFFNIKKNILVYGVKGKRDYLRACSLEKEMEDENEDVKRENTRLNLDL